MGARSYKIALADVGHIWDVTCGDYHGRKGVIGDPEIFIERYDAVHEKGLTRKDIDQWSAFENSLVDWDHTDFSRIVSMNSVAANTTVYLVTDEGLLDGCAFRFLRSEFDDFVRWYETEYRMDFFQSADYVLFDRNLHYVRILHHEGTVFGT